MPSADELLGPETAAGLVSVLARAVPDAPLARTREAARSLADLALRARCDRLAEAVLADLPGSLADLAAVVHRVLADDVFTGWMVWPVTEAVSARALAEGGPEAFDAGLATLATLTPRLTSEFAIRPMIAADPERALAVIGGWAAHPDEHVRRLASEGTRPYLPWAGRIPALLDRPDATIAILDALRDDESAYVRRSVANHLNDLSRHHGELVVATAARWLEEPSPATASVVRHGLRTLVKRGDPAALALLGFGPVPAVIVTGPRPVEDVVSIGGELVFEVELENTGDEPARLVVDYVVHHRRADGSSSPKVFKLSTRTLAAGAEATLRRRHSFRPVSTRRYHPGPHVLEVQVNGRTAGRAGFELAEG